MLLLKKNFWRKTCMKKSKKLFVLLFVYFVLGIIAMPVPANAAGAKKSLGMIFNSYGNRKLHSRVDLTGDGKADQLNVQITGSKWSNNKLKVSLSMSVNKKKAQKFFLSDDAISISYISLSKNIQLIRIQSGSSAYTSDDFFVQYNKSTNKFNTVLKESLGGFLHGYEIIRDISIVNKNTMKIKYFIQPCLTGPINISYTYVYSNKSFKRKSNTATSTSMYYKSKNHLTSSWYQDGYQKYFYSNKFVAMKNLIFYNSPGGKKYFSLKRKGIATLEGFYSKNNNTYLIFKYNKKKGYIKLNNHQQNSFYGVSNRMVN